MAGDTDVQPRMRSASVETTRVAKSTSARVPSLHPRPTARAHSQMQPTSHSRIATAVLKRCFCADSIWASDAHPDMRFSGAIGSRRRQ
jgi:hypothetical protein